MPGCVVQDVHTHGTGGVYVCEEVVMRLSPEGGTGGCVSYDPACVACRRASGKPDAGVTTECRAHEVERLTRERDDARTEAELMKQVARVLERERDSLNCSLREGGDTLHCRPDRPCERCRRLLAEMERDRLRALLATICDGFDQGVFCRDVSGDARGGWAIKLLPYLKALADAKAAVKAAVLEE